MLKERVEEVLGNIRPALQADGGDVELVDVTEDGIVKVRLKGACCGTKKKAKKKTVKKKKKK